MYRVGITNNVHDDNYNRYIGYRENNACIDKYFDAQTVSTISKKITQLLQGVDPKGRPIIIPDKTIYSVMSTLQDNYQPPTGDIHSRYTIPSREQKSMVQSLIDQTIEILTADVRNNYAVEESNSRLSIWTTVLGDFNPHNLRSFPPIKILKKRPATMQFNMNY